MKTKYWKRGAAILTPALMLIFLTAGSGCGSGGSVASEHDHEEPAEAGTHMEDDHTSPEGRHLEVDAGNVREWGVETAAVVPRRSRNRLSLTGEIHENENTTYRVHARVSGIAKHVTRDVGDRVSPDQVLCILSSEELLRMRTRFTKAVQVFREAEADFDRAGRLRKINAIEARQFTKRETVFKAAMAELFSLEADLKAVGEKDALLESVRKAVFTGDRGVLRAFLTPDYRILSPVEGRVAARDIVLGQAVSTDSPIFEIIDPRRVWAVLDLLERDMASVNSGTPVKITSDVYPGVAFSGQVTVMMPRMDRHLRSVKVRVVVNNPDFKLKAGMYVKGAVELEGGERMLSVPSTAITRLFGVNGVFLAEPEGFHFHPVRLKGEDDAGFVFLEGLEAGEKVAFKSVYLLKAELELRAGGGGGDAHEGHSH